MTNWKEIGLVVTIVILLGWAVIVTNSSREEAIRQWCRDHGTEATSIEFHTWDTGPYWYLKGTSVYRFTTTFRQTYWTRYGGWNHSVYKEEDDGQYTQVE